MNFFIFLGVFICFVKVDCLQRDSLFFTSQPEDLTAIEGYPATLKCAASDKFGVTFHWTLDGQHVRNDTRRRMIGSDLHISRVNKLYDIGEFKCVITNVTSGKSISSRGSQINILWIDDTIQVIQAESSKTLSIGDEMVLRCKADGTPETQVSWFKNGIRLLKNKRISFHSHRVHIAHLKLEDSGIYSCKAVNDAGSVFSAENFALRLSNGNSPLITIIPRDVIVREKGTAYFECSYENVASVEWLFRNEQIKNSSRHILHQNGFLQITSVESHDEGLYKCVGKSFSTNIPNQEYAVELKLAYIENMTFESLETESHSDKTLIIANDSYEVTCLAPNGLPQPKMWWEDPKGHVINDSGRIRIDDMRLIISEVRESDAGLYSCFAENIAEQRKISFSLIVSTAPIILRHPVDNLSNEGEVAQFQCIYNDSFNAVVAWLKEEIYLKDTGNHIIINEVDGNSKLTIRNVGMSDAGTYQCEVRSEEFPPVYSKMAILSVKEKLKFIPAPVNRKLELGSNAKIYCKAGGSTPPMVKWIKIDGAFFEWPPHIKDDNGTLHFNHVLTSDTGKYMCVATNLQGVINATIDVDVIVMPKFSVQPIDTVADEGDSVILHCLAAGDPLPIIQWDKNNELNGFNHNRFKVLANGSLFATEIHVDDEGKYGCTAGNSGGLRRHEVSLTIRYKDPNTNRIGRGGFGNDSENTMTKTVAITLGAAGIYIILVVGLMMWCRYRRAKRKAHMLAQATVDAENSDGHDVELKERTILKAEDKVAPEREANTEFIRSPSFSKLSFPREKLSTVMLLGHGEFGEVFLAKAIGIVSDSNETVVMVKSLENNNENTAIEFKEEIALYSKMSHENVGIVLGVCQDTKPHSVIMDYTDWGDLKQFLLATTPGTVSKGPKQSPLSVPQNLMICQQVAVGMEYLSKQFTHKDLATRNCLISSNLKIKISCPCLSLDTYSQEYFHFDSRIIPLRWAPKESVLEKQWSLKSDIWAFAVLVWEVFNKAELPYADVTNEDVLRKLKAGELKLSSPEDAPESLVEFLGKCWLQNSNDRPSFSDAVAVFVELSVAVQM